MQEKCSVTIDETCFHILPTPPAIHLKTADDVRLELGKVYRDMRSGKIRMEDGTKLAFVLSQLNKAIETGIIESRMAALELTIKPRKQQL